MNYQNIVISELWDSLEKRSNWKIKKEILWKIIEQRSFVIDEVDYSNDLIVFYSLEKTCKDLNNEEINDILWKKLFDKSMDQIINSAKIELYELLLTNITPWIISNIKINQPQIKFINDVEWNSLTLIDTINEDNKLFYICKNTQNLVCLVDNNWKIIIESWKYSKIEYAHKTFICTINNWNSVRTEFYDLDFNQIFLNLNNSLFDYKVLTDNLKNSYLLLISHLNWKTTFSIFNKDWKLLFGNNHFTSIENIVTLPDNQLILLWSRWDKYWIFDIEWNNIYWNIDGNKKYLYFQNPLTNEVYVTDQNMETRDIKWNEIFPIPDKYKGKKFEISYGQICEKELFLTYDKFMSISTFSININGNTKPWLKKFEPTRHYLKINKIN